MNSLTKGIVVIAVILGLGAILVTWKVKYGGHGADNGPLTHVSKEDMALLLKDASPMQLQQLAASPDAKGKIAENIKQLLAVASQARKDGLDKDPNIAHELESIRSVITASLYDKEINKDKGPMPPFSFITEDQVKAYLAKPEAEAQFKEFLDSKLALAKESGRFPADKELSEDELNQAKEDFAKIKIYEAEAEAKKAELGEEFERNLNLQVKLQQAQFLASRYAQKTLVEKTKVTDEDVQKYITEHPELDPKEKKAKAEQILSRAKAGEDFAKLANEFTEDPGNKDPKGELQGGLYKDITKGKMVPAFEAAALGLEPGQIADTLVETPYGYHIIKLERKGEGKDASDQPAETYDARHILITTTVKDPENPMGREVPVNEMVKGKLEEEKQKATLDEIVKNNPIEVAEDFEIPKPSEEEMKKAQEEMMQQMPGGMMPPGMQPPPSAPDAPKGKTPPSKKPEKK